MRRKPIAMTTMKIFSILWSSYLSDFNKNDSACKHNRCSNKLNSYIVGDGGTITFSDKILVCSMYNSPAVVAFFFLNLILTWRSFSGGVDKNLITSNEKKKNKYTLVMPPFEKRGHIVLHLSVGRLVCRPSDVQSISFESFVWSCQTW